MSTLGYVIVMLVLFAGSAFFSSAEMAISSANRMRLENAAEDGSGRAKTAVTVLDRYEDALSAILVGNNLCNIGSDSIVTLLTVLLLGEANSGIIHVATTLLVTLFIIIFCESAPKIIAKKNANRLTMGMAPALRFLMILLWPVIRIVTLLIRLIMLPFRGETEEDTEEEAAAELQSIIETVEDEGVIDEDRSELLQAALDFSEIAVMDVMTARVDMEAVCIDDDWEDILETVENAPYSRIPVYGDSVDDIIGVLYLNHFFKAMLDSPQVDIRSLLMEPLYVYKTTRLPSVLNQLRKQQKHLAIVTDEYGGTLGIVTLEDVLEQIVGDIWDETDEVEDEIVEREGGVFELDGDLPIGDLAELLDMGEDALETDSATVGGWTMEKYGDFPRAGDSVVSDGLKATVLEMAEDGRRVERVLIEKLPGEE